MGKADIRMTFWSLGLSELLVGALGGFAHILGYVGN